jgi:hypothetical protein
VITKRDNTSVLHKAQTAWTLEKLKFKQLAIEPNGLVILVEVVTVPAITLAAERHTADDLTL